MASTRWHQVDAARAFEELADRNAAEAARGHRCCSVAVARRRAPDDPEEFYDHQLVGLAAYDARRRAARRGDRPRARRRQDLLTIRTPDGRDALVPFVKALVPEVDLAARRVVIADRPGLVTPLED